MILKKKLIEVAFPLEAVQFALKPRGDRVAKSEPSRQPHSWVRSVRFEGGILDGKRFDFSDQLNCRDVTVGSIDEPGIQEAIVSIMEGGQEAFARRKEIYKLWKQ